MPELFIEALKTREEKATIGGGRTSQDAEKQSSPNYCNLIGPIYKISTL
jgi:hypothetical protein